MPLSLTKLMHEVSVRQGPRTGSFEFDEAKLRLMCKNIVEKINSKMEEDLPANLKGAFSIESPIDGKAHRFHFRVRQINDDLEYSHSAAATWNRQQQEISMTVPNSMAWFQYPLNVWENMIYKNITHELTHAFDIKGNIAHERGKFSTGESGKDLNNYYQDPAEVKAYIAQIGAELTNLVRENPYNLQLRPEQLLDLTPTWPEIKEYYKNNKKALKMFLTSAYQIIQSNK